MKVVNSKPWLRQTIGASHLRSVTHWLRTGVGCAMICLSATATSAETLAALAPTETATPIQRPLPKVHLPIDTPRPLWRRSVACTEDGKHCIRPHRYVEDVCGVIETLGETYDLPPDFIARLIWVESLFNPDAVSSKGAEGIAQFMPDTASRRGLADPFNPAEALLASSSYLDDLRTKFGNLGLAAAAYNGGEARLARFLSNKSGLPRETRAYVFRITGAAVDDWRKAVPETDMRLDPEKPFSEACVAHAAKRSWQSFYRPQPYVLIYAAHPNRDIAERRAKVIRDRHAAVFDDNPGSIGPMRMPGQARSLYAAQLGFDNRSEARHMCSRLRAAGGGCMVLRP